MRKSNFVNFVLSLFLIILTLVHFTYIIVLLRNNSNYDLIQHIGYIMWPIYLVISIIILLNYFKIDKMTSHPGMLKYYVNSLIKWISVGALFLIFPGHVLSFFSCSMNLNYKRNVAESKIWIQCIFISLITFGFYFHYYNVKSYLTQKPLSPTG